MRPLRTPLPARRAAGCIAAAVLALAAPARGQPADTGEPQVLLPGATVPRARALALDAALRKGWRLADRNREHLVFETRLEQPASPGPPGATPPPATLLRIRARFSRTAAGAVASLQAQELWWAGSEHAWSAEVTDAYRDNLHNALASLRRQWRALQPPGAGAPESEPRTATVPAPPGAAAAPRALGTWAFHAERLAQARGCILDEAGAELIGGAASARRDGTELHRVGCANRAALRVRCDAEGCTAAGRAQ